MRTRRLGLFTMIAGALLVAGLHHHLSAQGMAGFPKVIMYLTD